VTNRILVNSALNPVTPLSFPNSAEGKNDVLYLTEQGNNLMIVDMAQVNCVQYVFRWAGRYGAHMLTERNRYVVPDGHAYLLESVFVTGSKPSSGYYHRIMLGGPDYHKIVKEFLSSDTHGVDFEEAWFSMIVVSAGEILTINTLSTDPNACESSLTCYGLLIPVS